MDNFNVKEATIKIIGVGGAGGNTIDNIYAHTFKNVDLIVANTDVQALKRNHAPIKISLGENLTRGLGAGGDPEKGMRAAKESLPDIEDCLRGADLIIITGGMGGGTGTGGIPVIAEAAKKLNSLVMAVVTKPFKGEGNFKVELAEKSIEELKPNVDAMIIIPNDRLLTLSSDITSKDAFKQADNVLIETLTGITDIITTASTINVDFADIESILRKSGTALVGIGNGSGVNRHMEAIKKALNFPLIENADIHNAKGLISFFKCNDNFKAKELQEVMDFLNKKVSNPSVKIKFGVCLDNSLPESDISITLIASGFGYENNGLDVSRKHLLKMDVEPCIENTEVEQTDKMNINKPAYLRRKTSILD
ncbi:MAG: cell division protein FtsZ [Elusimicrobiales bacterium]|nr:cell division protein FtsZ [Elusimicrobiales bacterium]NLH40005.1 cell division protein FtsZ [Elusimicrobiota bacterium]